MRYYGLVRNTSLLVLLVGFGVLLALIAVAGTIAVGKANTIFGENAAINVAYDRFQFALGGLRSEIFLASLYVHELMLDSQSKAADEQRNRLKEGEELAQRYLQELKSTAGPELSSDIDELRDEIESYWAYVAPALEDPELGAPQDFETLQREFVARHDAALAITRRIEDINRESVERRRKSLVESQDEFIRYIWSTLVVTLGLGFVVAGASGYGMYRLQRRADRQRRRREKAESELRRLSSQLLRAQEEERRHLSRELHDEVGQTLTALGMELGNIEQLRAGSPQEFKHHLKEAKRLMQDTLGTVRNIAMGLRPSMLDDSGLAPALRWQTREFSKHTGIPVAVDLDGQLDSIGDLQRTCIYRVVQEALTNCARHSQAKNAHLTLRQTSERVKLEVQDDGVGFGSDASYRGMGLIGIEERVRELGGSVEIVSKPGKGTRLLVEIPLNGHA
jgi:signal transduction histidine kinase